LLRAPHHAIGCAIAPTLNTAGSDAFTLRRFGYAFTPDFRKIAIIGHQLVKADWARFSPTNAVNKNQYGLTQ
jgi:hypothetical protein